MKNTILSASIVALMAVSAFAQNNNNDNSLIARAKAALKSECSDAQGNLQSSIHIVSTCFYTGSITNITFYRKPNCPGNQVCIAVIIPVGTVQLGCDGSVIDVTCGPFVSK